MKTSFEETLERLRNNDPTLTSLRMVMSGIGDAEAAALADALRINTTLTSLNINHNRISHTGATALAEVLKTNKTLTSLVLSGNGIGDAGIMVLADMLKTNSSLKILDISEIPSDNVNAIMAGTPLEIAPLAEALTINKTLTTICLSSNSIDKNGLQSLAGLLKTNNTLTSINCVWNYMDAEDAATFADALKGNTTLTSLALVTPQELKSRSESGYAPREHLNPQNMEALTGHLKNIETLLQRNKRLKTPEENAYKQGTVVGLLIEAHKADLPYLAPEIGLHLAQFLTRQDAAKIAPVCKEAALTAKDYKEKEINRQQQEAPQQAEQPHGSNRAAQVLARRQTSSSERGF